MYKWLDAAHTLIRRLADGVTIPVDPANADYQEVQAWIGQGNAIAEKDAATQAQLDEIQRLLDLDDQITSSAMLNTLKVMTNAQFNTWWAANVTNLAQANVVIKLLTRIILRRLL